VHPEPQITTTPRRTPRLYRRVAWIAAALCLVALVASIVLLGQAIARYQQTQGRRQFYYEFIDSTSFALGGLPVEITQEIDDAGRGEVIVRYAQDELRLDVQIPNPNTLPLILRQANWFRVLRWADGTGMNIDEFDDARRSGERPEHYVIVTRSLAPGAPPGSWGDVWRNEWVFNFYTFLPPPADAPPGVGGGFAHERWEYPESPRAYDRRVQAAILRGDPAPPRNPRELQEDSWQYGAAMLVMPAGTAPPHTFNRGVLMQNRWLVATASVSIIGLIASIAIAAAPPRVRA
jgi:hypothetical protein